MKSYATFAAAAALVAVPAFAGNESAQQSNDMSTDKQAARAAVVGEVIDTRNVTLQGPAGNQHQLYKLRTADGSTVVVDVGQMQSNAEAPALQKGDLAMAIGSKARINGRPVLFARYYGESYSAGMGAREQSQGSAATSGASR